MGCVWNYISRWIALRPVIRHAARCDKRHSAELGAGAAVHAFTAGVYTHSRRNAVTVHLMAIMHAPVNICAGW